MSDDDIDPEEAQRLDAFIEAARKTDPYEKPPPENVIDFPPIEAYDETKHAPDPDPIRVLTIGQVQALEADDSYLGDLLLHPGGRVLISGPPKSGKSQLTIEMMLQAACGGTWMGMRFEAAYKVIYCNAEIRAEYLAKRFSKILPTFDVHQLQLIRQNFLVTGRGDLSLRQDRRRIEAMISFHRPTFLVIDPLSNFIEDVNESDNSEMRELFKTMLNPLTENNALCTILVHHTRKGKGEGGFDAARGAGATRAWYDSGMILRPIPGSVELSFEERNGVAPDTRCIKLDPDTLRFVEFQADVKNDYLAAVLDLIGVQWTSIADVTAMMLELADEHDIDLTTQRQQKRWRSDLYAHPEARTRGEKKGKQIRKRDV